MPDIRMRLGRDVLVVDGAFGTMLERYSVPPEQAPVQLNISAPEMVQDILHNYVLAGADCVTTNTFGGNRIKLAEWGLEEQIEQLNRQAVRVARATGAQHVLADMGPTGLVLQPLGDASFDHLFEVFAEQASALAAEQPDAIIIETMVDIAEARCAVLAARSVCDLPVFVTCTFGLDGRMELSATDPETAAIVLEAAGAEAVGLNCGLGPEQMLVLVERMASATSLPIIAQPNAGLPMLVDGITTFPGTPDEMGQYAARFVEAGASLVGSCCGSTPAYTGAIGDFARQVPVRDRAARQDGATRVVTLAGPRGFSRIGDGLPFTVIGERINPTGKPALKESLLAGSMTVVRDYAVEQQAAGAHLLDVNVGTPGVEATVALPAAVLALVSVTDLPLVLDTTDSVALEAALRAYPGRALINSVNGSPESMEAVLPLAATYGAAVVVLALDDAGIPETAEGRVAVVERVRAAAHRYGLSDEDLIVDALTLTAATDGAAARETLHAVRAVSERFGLATMLGVSNVSHGLPGRPGLNAAFLSMARACGLDAAIVNPSDGEIMRAIAAGDALLGSDERAERWIAIAGSTAAQHSEAGAAATRTPDTAAEPASARDRLARAIERGDADGVPALVDQVIREGLAAERVIGDVMTPAIQRLGDDYGRGEVFLPQLMVAADAMKAGVARAKSHIPEGERTDEGTVVFATVKGDIHSIGKDICISLLESNGFVVNDLGVDVEPEAVSSAAAAADAVCLSALMTTTLPAMKRTIERVAATHPGTPVFVGGAVVTADWAASVGAGYSDDAPGCVAAVRAAVGGRGAGETGEETP